MARQNYWTEPPVVHHTLPSPSHLMPARLLCIGDIHLGRRPSRIPGNLSDYGVRAGDLTPAAAWRRAVEVAIEQRVNAVVLAGDVVESDNQYFEAYGPLQAGVQRLVAAGIPVIGVAGNHDTLVLPRLATDVPGFTLLGRGGTWESHVLEVDGVPAVRFLGWSFPQKIVPFSPLDTVPAAVGDLPTIGVLHCDLDARGSVYAPISTAALRAAPGDAWLLGHIHSPSAQPGPAPRGYLGNISSLDPGETGQRGAWLLDVKGPGDVSLSRLYISPLRWESVQVDLGQVSEPDDLEGAIVRAVHALHGRLEATLGETRAVGCRVKLVGASPKHRAIVASLEKKDARALRSKNGDCIYFVESVEDDARQAVDLAELARGTDPPALLANMLLEVQNDTDAGRRIVREAMVELDKTARMPNWAQLGPVVDLPASARHHVLRAGLGALEALLAQREPA